MTPLALLLALAAAAQEPAAAPAPEPAASTAPAPGDGVHVAGEEPAKPKPALKRPMRATILKRSKDWEPVSLAEGGDPYQAATGATVRLLKTGKGYRGVRSKAKAAARAYPGKPGEAWLVVTVSPKELEKARKHFEVRLRVVEGFVEKVEVALVTVTDRRAYKELDKPSLRRLGVAFEEESPGSAEVLVSALDPRPGKSSWNAGKVRLAAFADPQAGFADFSWSVKGVATP
ncbi:MAG: hypothetical protein SF051_00790 [Elusimicrobiota bacterium]|nr:hypothetical protein [Elusimicrobiota bacterium]